MRSDSFLPSVVAGWLHADIAILVIVALAIRVAMFLPVHTVGYTSDEQEYITMASQLEQGKEFVDSNGERSTRAPLYPYVLAMIFALSGNSLLVAHLVGCVFGALVVLIAFQLGLEVWNDRWSALLGAGIMAGYPGLVIYASVLQTETLYTALLLLALWLAYRAVRRPSGGTMALLGLCGGLAALTRAVFFGFFPVLLAGIWWVGRKEERSHLVPILLSAVVFLAVIAPWTVRNYRIHRTLVPISSGGGNSLLTGNNPFASGTWRLEPGFDRWFSERARELGVRDVRGLEEVERSRVSGLIAREYIASHPLATLSLAAKKAHVFFVYPITNTDSMVALQAFAVACDILLLVGAVAGLAACCRGPGRPWGLLITIGFFALTQLVFHAEARFRLPLVPLICLFAGLGVSVFLDRERRREILANPGARRTLAAGGLVVAVVYGVTGIMFSRGLL